VVVGVVTASAPTPTLPAVGDAGLRATLADFEAATGDDPTGAKTVAFTTLQDFVNPHGPYGAAWWLADGQADIAEVLAVLFYTEGNTSFDVRTAVAARYLWYCGGTGDGCGGRPLINFLSYFQPWRQPWAAGGFTSAHAEHHLEFAGQVVWQQPGLLTTLIPGADTYSADPAGLGPAGPVAWGPVPFHFANVHSTWDTYLREQLRRLPNGPARLWVLSMDDAARVCGTPFLCPDMTQARE
jgi:hypothetical protein